MLTNIEKNCDVFYDELCVINVIESDDTLTSILMEDVRLPFNIIKSLSNEGKLNDNTKNVINGLFEHIILNKQVLFDKYKELLNGESIVRNYEESSIEVEETKDTYTQLKENKKKFPKWYGKNKIIKDIQNQNGQATNTQITALAVNDLKNIYLNLNNKMIHDMFSGSQSLTDEEYREIRATINILKNKMKPIFNKKNKKSEKQQTKN
jgi:hypothetical protein